MGRMFQLSVCALYLCFMFLAFTVKDMRLISVIYFIDVSAMSVVVVVESKFAVHVKGLGAG